MTGRGAHLDHAAGASPDPRVRNAMARALDELWASPHGLHDASARSFAAVEEARAAVAALVGAQPEWVVLTAGATEARNLAVKGALAGEPRLGGRVVTSLADHPVTLAVARTAARAAGGPVLVPVDGEGRVAPEALADALGDPALVSIAHAQAEIGTLQDVAALVAAVRDACPGAVVHVDAAESAALAPIDLRSLDADLLTLGGPGLDGPPWTGALVVRPGTRLHPLLEGGSQEAGKRAGAEDLPAIVGLGVAARLARAEGRAWAARLAGLSDRLLDGLLAVPDVRLNGPRAGRLPGVVQVSAGWVEAQTLVAALAARGVAVSPGSACTAAARKASPLLEAIGLEAPWTHSAVLFTLGPRTTGEEVDLGVRAFAEAVAALREISPLAPAR